MNTSKDYGRIARSLEEDLRAQMASVDQDLAEVQPLLQVAELLGNTTIRTELSDDVQRLTARHEALRQAARILQSRQARDGPEGAVADTAPAASVAGATLTAPSASPTAPSEPATAPAPTVPTPTPQQPFR